MDSIKGVLSYINSMSTTLYDKCWWIDKLPSGIDTVVDFGCAQGDLAVFINRIYPNKFKYIGVDNSPEMLSLALHNHKLHFPNINSEFLDSISDVSSHCEPASTVLVLNSVMHEVFSYLSDTERDALFGGLFGLGFRCIAIRDMYMNRGVRCSYGIFNAVQCSKYGEQWKEFRDICLKRGGDFENPHISMSEFLLKYRYIDNWQREKAETYLWQWDNLLTRQGLLHRYENRFEHNFLIPYIKDRIRSDFGFEWNYCTHKKLLLQTKEGD